MENKISKGLIVKLLIGALLLVGIVSLFLIPRGMKKVNNDEFIYGSKDFSYGVSKLSILDQKEVERNPKPKTDGGLTDYPSPDNIIRNLDLKTKILAENIEIMDFDSLDEEGNLYKKGIKSGKKIIKHQTADSQYLGEISDNAKAYEKTILIDSYNIGNTMTGLYIPAGEVVKIEIPKEFVNNGLMADIGRGSSRSPSNNIPLDRDFSRMPHIVKRIKLDKEVNYVANPLGGPLYIHTENTNANIETTITGAIEYPHFILGTTSKNELERLLNESEGLIFDLEVPGVVRLTMPKTEIEGMKADELIEAAIFWEKAGSLSNYINQGEWYRRHVITQIYDSYVPAGAAVAFVGASFSVMPIGWARASVDISELTNYGTWGNFHEFNHHHQSGIGAQGGGEVTNNVINILSYIEYTNISNLRNDNDDLSWSDWNRHVDPSFPLRKVNAKNPNRLDLELYTTMIHSFGVRKFAEAFRVPTGGKNSNFYRNMSDYLGVDLTYYLNELNNLFLTKEDLEYVKAKNYPTYIPVSSVYQVGQVQNIYDKEKSTYTKEVIKTAQPFDVDVNKNYNITKHINVPKDFSFEITNISEPKYGEIESVNNQYIYTPTKEKEYDELSVEINLTNGVISSTETLILGFGVQKEQATQRLTSTIYNNKEEIVTKENLLDYDKLEIKERVTSEGTHAYYQGAKNDVMVTEGQIIMPESKEYTFYIAADDIAKLYIGTDKDNLKEVAHTNTYLTNYNKDLENTKFSVKMETDKPLYFRHVVLNNDGIMGSKIGYDNGEKIIDIPNQYVYSFNGSLEYHSFYKDLGSFEYRHEDLVNVIGDIDYSDAKIEASDNFRAYNQDYELGSIIDGDLSKGFHTAVNNSVFPGVLTIDYNEIKKFNTVEIHALRNEHNPRGLPKDVKLFISSDGKNFTEVFDGTIKHDRRSMIELEKTVEAKYLKIEIYSSHREGYIGIGEIKISNSFTNGKVVNAENNQTTNTEKFNKITDGAFLNGFALEAKNQTMKFKFKGNNIAIYSAFASNYGTMQVRVNGGNWTDVNLNSEEQVYGKLSFIETGLENEINEIEIRSSKKDLINIDYFVVNELYVQNDTSKKFDLKLMLIVGIPTVLVITGSLIFFMRTPEEEIV